MEDPTQKWNRPYAEQWLEQLRGMERCAWCGEDEKPLSREIGFCQTSRCYPNCISIQPRLNVTPEIIQKSYLALRSGVAAQAWQSHVRPSILESLRCGKNRLLGTTNRAGKM
jgi:hypothetical protein